MKQLRVQQIAQLSHYISQPKCMDLSDPGTGKTPPVCVNMYRRLQDGVGRTIWVQPKSLMAKNKVEITEFTPINDNQIAIIDGTPAKVDQLMRAQPAVMLMGPDRFKRMMKAGTIPPDVTALDVDEFHMCFGGAGTGNVGGFTAPSGRTAAFYDFMGRQAKEGVFMTGTLVNGRLDTAFPAIHAIEPRYYPFGYEDFLGGHVYLDDRGRPIAWHNHERIRQILGRHGIRFTFEQVHGKQEVVKEVQWCAMNEKQERLYKTFERDAILELEHFMIEGTLPGVKTIRARQVMEHPNHFPDLRDVDGTMKLPPVDIMPGERPAKLEAIEIHLVDHNINQTPVLIFAFLKPQQREIAELARKMGRRVALMNGDTSGAQRNEIDLAFKAGQLDTLVLSPGQVTSVGWNWQFCGDKEVGHVMFASLGYMDSDFIQGFRRAIRGPRKIPLRVTTLAYLNSVDIRVMTILEGKSRDANLVDPTREVLRFVS